MASQDPYRDAGLERIGRRSFPNRYVEENTMADTAGPPHPGTAWQDTPEGVQWALENHPPSPEAARLLDEATARYSDLLRWVQANVPRSAERALAMNDGRASLRGVKAAIACHQDQL